MHLGTSITEGPNAFAWLLDQIEDNSDMAFSGRFSTQSVIAHLVVIALCKKLPSVL